MGLPTPSQFTHPSPSALQTFINSHKVPNGCDPHLYNLALQIAHNLHYQHNWTDVRIHLRDARSSDQLFPRPLLSGLPPKRLYIHPDEQVELLRRQKRDRDREGKTDLSSSIFSGDRDGGREREWVLPSHLREKWSLRRFGEVFDAVGVVPGDGEGEVLFWDDGDVGGFGGGDGDAGGEGGVSKWRTSKPKRALLAILDDDSTVVYYIVHDGIVKPRQN